MADRTVTVELVAKTDRYTIPVTAAADATERLDQKVEALNRDLNKIPEDAAKAAAGLRLLGAEQSSLRTRIEDSRTSIQKFSDDVENAKTKLVEDEKQGSFLRRAFGLTGIPALAKEIGQRFSDLGLQAGDAFGKGFKGFLDAMPTELKLILGGIIATAVVGSLAAIGAAVNGLLLSTTGLGGIGLIVAGQFQSPLVRASVAQLGHDLMNALGSVTAPFAGRLGAGVGVIDTGLKNLLSILAPSLQTLSNAINPLAQGLAKMFVALGPGLSKAFEAAGPILLVLAARLPSIGRALSDFFSNLSRGSKGASEGLIYLIDGLNSIIRTSGQVIRVLSDVFQFFVAFADTTSGILLKAFGWIPGLGTLIKKTHDMFHDIRSGTDEAGLGVDNLGSSFQGLAPDLQSTTRLTQQAAAAFQNLSKGLDAAFNRTMGVDQATLQLNQSMLALSDSVQKNGTSLKENTKEGQANLGTIQQSISSINSLRDANIANGTSIDDANAQYRSQLDQLQATLIKLGFNKDAIKAMIDQYRQIPGQVSTIVNVLGLDAATTKLDSITQKFDSLNGRVVTTYLVTDTSTGQQQTIRHTQGMQRWGGIYQHAESGLLSAGIYPATSPARYAFAEPATGGEAFVPRFGDYNRSMGILDSAARWYGARVMPAGGGATVNVAPPSVQVFIGDEEITDRVRVVVQQENHATASAVSGGVRL